MPVDNNPLNVVYNRWERFLNDVSKTVGQDRELDELSNKVNEMKTQAFAGGSLTTEKLDALYARMELVAKAYEKVAKDRGFPVNATLPTSAEAFKVYGENAQIHFGKIAGDEIKDGKVGGLLGDLRRQLGGQPLRLAANKTLAPGSDSAKTARMIAMDIVASASPQVAEAKVH